MGVGGDCFPSESECLGSLHFDQPYGASPSEALDLYLPRAEDGEVPLVVFLHGGGFVGGDKSRLWPKLTELLLSEGVAVASVNYRLAPGVRYPQPMLDGVRAIRFLRERSSSFRLDADRFVLSGIATGGAIALWIALRDDRPAGSIAGVIAINAQTTYDPEDIWTLFRTKRLPGFLPQLFGVTAGDLSRDDPMLRQLVREASPATHLGAGDPPVVLLYTRSDRLPPVNAAPFSYLHHARFGEFLEHKAEALGADVRLRPRVGAQPGSEPFNRTFVQELGRILAPDRR